MQRNKINLIALCLITLFLLGNFSENISGQQSNSFYRQTTIVKSGRVITADFNANNRTDFFAKETFPTGNRISPNEKQTVAYTRPNAEKRFKKYANRTFGASALLGTVVSAGFAQLIDSPEEWENNGTGFARRVGSAFGKTAIEETTVYGLDEALKLDSNFYRSGKKDFGSRVKNAFLTTFTARRANGKRVIGVPRIVGAYTSNVIATEAWYPPNYNYKDGIRYGTYSLGFNVLVNVFREFFNR